MTQNKVYTFSVVTNDRKNFTRVEKIKRRCKEQGQSFSWVVLKALELLEKQDTVNKNAS